MNADKIKQILCDKPQYRECLFSRGYFMTDNENVCFESYPFYGNWKVVDFCEYKFCVHPKQKFNAKRNEGLGMVLIGHAFNPLAAEKNIDEGDLLNDALALYQNDKNAFYDFFDQWTGSFNLFVFSEKALEVYGDAAGMYMNFYGTYDGKQYCSSHSNLLGDICNLEFDDYIERLIDYRFYPLFGKALPGDLSPYKNFKRLIPNHYARLENGEWMHHRFFPRTEALLMQPYSELIDKAANILSNSMRIIYQKWNRPAISLTGGCDSKTTLSCANGVYDKYKYFSYISSSSEAVDAVAASKICKQLAVPHTIYEISENNEDYSDIDAFGDIMEYNSGSIGKNNENDIRKRAFFHGTSDFDVEVKSWVSEIARAYYHKRFSKKKFPKKLTARYATTLYKVFIANRKLVQDTDRVFAEFLSDYYFDDSFKKIPWYDLFFWEFRVSSWNGLVITGEQQITSDIVIPYNNRVLLQCLLSTPVEKRRKDQPHLDIMQTMNKQIANCGISVVNIKHTKNRSRLERMYLEIFSKIPF